MKKLRALLVLFFICLSSVVDAFFAYDRAAYAAQKGDWQLSQELLKKVVLGSPQDPQVLYDMGVASFRAENIDQARAYFLSAATAPSASSELQEQAYFNAGNASVSLEKLSEAVTQYQSVLAINPENERAKHNLSVVQEMLNQKEQQQQEQKQQDQKNKQNNKQDKKDNNQQKSDSGQQSSEDEQQPSDEQQQEQSKKEQQEQQKKQEEQKGLQKQGSQVDQQEGGQQPDERDDQQNAPKRGTEQSKDQANSNQRQKQGNNQNKHTDPLQQKEEPSEAQQPNEKPAVDSSSTKSTEKRESAQQGAAQDKEGGMQGAEQKVDAWLAEILQEQEKRDAALNKQVIKMNVGQQAAKNNGKNSW